MVGATWRLHRLYLLDREHWAAPLGLLLLLGRNELEVAVVHDFILAGLYCQTQSLLLECIGRRDVEQVHVLMLGEGCNQPRLTAALHATPCCRASCRQVVRKFALRSGQA